MLDLDNVGEFILILALFLEIAHLKDKAKTTDKSVF
jgi:hypothetical protein